MKATVLLLALIATATFGSFSASLDDRITPGLLLKRKTGSIGLMCKVSRQENGSQIKEYKIYLLKTPANPKPDPDDYLDTCVGNLRTSFSPFTRSMLISELNIGQNFQRKGYAQNALIVLFRTFKNRPLISIKDYILMVEEDNKPAVALYKKLGFIFDQDNTENFKKMLQDDSLKAIFMKLPRQAAEEIDLQKGSTKASL